MDIVREVLEQAKAFEQEAHTILAVHETSKSRVVILEKTYEDLDQLNIRQDELFRQSLRCAESALFRAAHVMAWTGFIDFLLEKLASDNFQKLLSARPNWKIRNIDDLREQYTDHALIEASKDMRLCYKSEMKALLGLLNKRNECAHPSNFYPGLNETLGYISELIQRIETIGNR